MYLASMAIFVAGLDRAAPRARCRRSSSTRILQGLGAGTLQPTQQAILRQTFPPEEQGMAMALYSMVVMIGPAVGPCSMLITDNYAGPWIFYINLPGRNHRHHDDGAERPNEPEDVRTANCARPELARENLDIAGIVLMVVGIGALQYLFRGGGAAGRLVSTRWSILHRDVRDRLSRLAGFVIIELTATAPVVNLRIFKDISRSHRRP